MTRPAAAGAATLVVAALLTFLVAVTCAECVLDCEKYEGARNRGRKSSQRRYMPDLLTLSRLDGGRYAIELRCRGTTLDGVPVPKDYVQVRVSTKVSPWLLEQDDNRQMTKFASFSCGGLCYSPLITEENLLTGRVCAKVRKDNLNSRDK